MNPVCKVAVVDDDTSVRESLEMLLRSAGWRTCLFGSAEEFLSSADLPESTCLVLDVNLPGMTGPELHGELLRRGHHFPVIFMTGRRNDELRRRALEAGAKAFYYKPFDDEEMLARIEEVIRSL